jgi:citrate synthase
MAPSATVIIGDHKYEFPIIEGTEGERAIDIQQLRAVTGLITFDPGYGNTGSCTSAITYIDGEKGILRYRGIPIEEFDTPHPDFIEVAWLILFGKLPTESEWLAYRRILTRNATLDESMITHFEEFPVKAPPMAILSAMINALTSYHPEFLVLDDNGKFEEASARLISKVRTIAAYSYRRSLGLPFIYPNPKLRYCGNFLHMMFSMPYEDYEVDPEVEDALNLILLMHADHEQNCSTATVRMVGSSQANLFASAASGVCALWGRLHGGANLAVIEMLDQMLEGHHSASDLIRMAKEKNSRVRLMGFGHRVYKNYDPRARILKRVADKLLPKLGISDPRLELALELEELALADPYFQERKLYPNVDFYSGILLRAIGIPTNMFPVMFSIGRLPGWIAQWKEQHDEDHPKIARPRQIYVGPNVTSYIPMKDRR